MILKTLSPVSFGRFQNREVALSRGVNLIEAPNEAGKSTLAAFVSGMLYGFYRRDVKKRLYTPAFDRYLPWDNPGKYFGAMELAQENAEYRLERNFLKDDVKLFEAATGRDVSDLMPYNASLRIREPGQFFLGISQTAFEGTLYVPQQSVRAGEGLSAELSDRIDALSETGSGGLSASGAVKWLAERRDAIGTPRRGSSPLGEQYNRLSALQEEKAESERKRARAAADAERERELRQEIAALMEAQQEGESALEKARRHVRWQRAEAAKAYHARVEKLEEALQALPNGTDADEALFERAIQDARQTGDLTWQVDELNRALAELDGRIESAQARADATGLNSETCALNETLAKCSMRATMLAGDLAARLEAERAARQALPPAPAVESQRAHELMARCEALPAAKPARALLALGAVFAALALFGFLFPAAFGSAAPAALLLALGIARNRTHRRVARERAEILGELHAASPEEFPALRAALDDRARAERALESAESAAASAKAALEDAERELSSLLSKTGAASPEAYNDALARYEAAQEDLRALKIRRAALWEQKTAVEAQMEARTRSVRQAFSRAGLDEPRDASAAPEVLNAHLRKIRARQDTARALEDAKRLLDECLGGDDYEALTANAEPEPECPQPADSLAAALEERAGRIHALGREMAACAARRDAIEDASRTPSEIDGEIALVQEKIDGLTLEAEALDEARARIERAADDMRRKLSPALSRSIAQVAGRVTFGRYDHLLIDTDLKVQALASGQSVSPDRLSGGTADAIHLALRLGLVEFLMSGKECPVILDDSFAQLDDERAARMLEVVAEFALTRQALILTCQSRTRRMLETLQIPHNAVLL